MQTQAPGRARPVRRRFRRLIRDDITVALLCAASALPVTAFLVAGPAFVDKVSVVNDSEYTIDVQVRGHEGEGWMSVNRVDKGSTRTREDVIDQGDVWIFRFRSQGEEGGELRTTRGDLEEDDWTIEVPEEVIRQLRRVGAPPSP